MHEHDSGSLMSKANTSEGTQHWAEGMLLAGASNQAGPFSSHSAQPLTLQWTFAFTGWNPEPGWAARGKGAAGAGEEGEDSQCLWALLKTLKGHQQLASRNLHLLQHSRFSELSSFHLGLQLLLTSPSWKGLGVLTILKTQLLFLCKLWRGRTIKKKMEENK